jgi:hypothetical protein
VREEYLQGARIEFEGRARLQNDFGTERDFNRLKSSAFEKLSTAA